MKSPTGRIIIDKPELQRIPAREPDIMALRRAHLEVLSHRREPLDYSSIEARMLAHVESTRDKLRHAPRALEAFDRYSASSERHRLADRTLAITIGILASLIAATPFICWAILYWD